MDLEERNYACEYRQSEEASGTPNILDRIVMYVRRFVSLSQYQSIVIALWIVHTYLIEIADTTPYLAITSAEKQCGKSRLLEVLESLVANPWLTGKVTAAVLSRKIDSQQPTLLLDETDAAFGSGNEYAEVLRGVLNTGHRRGGKASCCVREGDDFIYKDFSTFCPKALAGIGKLPDTVADRSIPIRLKRAKPGEVLERFRLRDIVDASTNLRSEIDDWCKANSPLLEGADPDLPQELSDRQQDGAEPLLAIADAAGGLWPSAARRSLVKLCREAKDATESTGSQLLSDIRDVFNDKNVARMNSAELSVALGAIETSPWCDWSRGRALTPPQLARLLQPFGIFPCCIRIGDRTVRGYRRDQFEDAFARYLRGVVSPEAPQSATVQQESGEEQ